MSSQFDPIPVDLILVDPIPVDPKPGYQFDPNQSTLISIPTLNKNFYIQGLATPFCCKMEGEADFEV